MSNTYYTNRVYHAPTAMPSRPCYGVKPSFQLQSHNQHTVVWLPCPGNPRDRGLKCHLLDHWSICLMCGCGGIWVWSSTLTRYAPPEEIRQGMLAAGAHGNGSGGRPEVAAIDEWGLWLPWAAPSLAPEPAEVWTPERAAGTVSKSQQKRAPQDAKHAKA